MTDSISSVVPVVELSRLRSEDGPATEFIEVLVAHSIPVKELSPIVQEARKKIASDPPERRPPHYLKLVVISKTADSETGSVLLGFGDASDSLEAHPILRGLQMKRVKAPALPPLSKKQAERWVQEQPDVWHTLFRPLTPEELPPVPLPNAEIVKIEGYMRIALEEARKALLRGDVCHFSAV